MAFDNHYPNRKDRRKPYPERKPKANCRSCRNHGSCKSCRNNRMYKNNKRELSSKEQLEG